MDSQENSPRMSRITLILAAIFASLCVAKSPKVSLDLPEASHFGRIDVIVQFNQTLSPELHGKVERKGGVLQRELGLIRAAVYSVPADVAASIADDPEVDYVSPDRPVQALL